MPSNAYKTFKDNLEYVNSIKSGPAKKFKNDKIGLSPDAEGSNLNHTNRAAVIILCASWEQYIEDVVRDSRNALIKSTDEWQNLHKPAQGGVGGSRKNPKHSQGTPELVIASWKNSYETYTDQFIEGFRSPTRDNINTLFRRTIGVTCRIFSYPSSNNQRLDNFVDLRHEIAHRGVQGSKIITLAEVQGYIDLIHKFSIKTDNYLLSELTNMHPNKTSPWDGKAK